MNKWEELHDFSMYEGHIPCILCKGESSLTLVGNHWKCSVCAHVFNQDGSDIGVECYCETCHDKKQAEVEAAKVEKMSTLEKIKHKVRKKLSGRKKKK